MCDCRSDPVLQRKDKGSIVEGAEMRHATTSSEPHTKAPADSIPQYRMIDVPPSDVPPSDYLTKPLVVDLPPSDMPPPSEYLTRPLAVDKVMDHPLPPS